VNTIEAYTAELFEPIVDRVTERVPTTKIAPIFQDLPGIRLAIESEREMIIRAEGR
jgi:hypothetical protein